VGRRAGMDKMESRKSLCPCRESNACRSVRSLVTILTELPRFLKMNILVINGYIVTTVRQQSSGAGEGHLGNICDLR
jgi:hypothetical protein